MKKITAIIRPEKFEPLKDTLCSVQVSGMTVSQVLGCGSQHGWTEHYRGTDIVLNMIPKIKLELVVCDEKVDDLVKLICKKAWTGKVGDGKIFVCPVDEVVRIRTGELGEDAI